MKKQSRIKFDEMEEFEEIEEIEEIEKKIAINPNIELITCVESEFYYNIKEGN